MTSSALPPVNWAEDPFIVTYTGRRFRVDAPTVSQVDIFDIAHSLSMQCRFTGHTKRFYSVAEHSVLVSRRVPEPFALCGLLHDATEAYLTDVAKPVKRLLPDYNTLESNLYRIIALKFGLPRAIPPEVKEADRAYLLIEANQLMPGGQGYSTPDEPWIVGWSPERAEQAFLDRFAYLYSTFAEWSY